MTSDLPVAVEIDDRTGRWSVDGIPMILAPQHMIVNYLRAAEDVLDADGVDALHRAGYRSARTWCTHQRDHLGLDEAAVLRRYLDQLGRRGWGRFTLRSLDLARGTAEIRLEHSSLADPAAAADHPTCWLFRGWLEGALDVADTGRAEPGYRVVESGCAGAGAAHCTFTGSAAGRA
jgi:predicted hydrocarbon binding protein